MKTTIKFLVAVTLLAAGSCFSTASAAEEVVIVNGRHGYYDHYHHFNYVERYHNHWGYWKDHAFIRVDI